MPIWFFFSCLVHFVQTICHLHWFGSCFSWNTYPHNDKKPIILGRGYFSLVDLHQLNRQEVIFQLSAVIFSWAFCQGWCMLHLGGLLRCGSVMSSVSPALGFHCPIPSLPFPSPGGEFYALDCRSTMWFFCFIYTPACTARKACIANNKTIQLLKLWLN